MPVRPFTRSPFGAGGEGWQEHDHGSHDVLTRRERQIVELLMEGRTNKNIALSLGISDQTVKNQLSSLYEKFDVGSRLELVMVLLRRGIVRSV